MKVYAVVKDNKSKSEVVLAVESHGNKNGIAIKLKNRQPNKALLKAIMACIEHFSDAEPTIIYVLSNYLHRLRSKSNLTELESKFIKATDNCEIIVDRDNPILMACLEKLSK